MPQLVICIPRDPAKPITFVNHALLKGLLEHGSVRLQRASHVVPVNRPKRWAFGLLRWIFGEKGRVAEWTRTWNGPWLADMGPSDGPILGPCRNRQTAIDAEIVWLNLHLKDNAHA